MPRNARETVATLTPHSLAMSLILQGIADLPDLRKRLRKSLSNCLT